MEPFSKELKVVLLYSIKTVVSHLKCPERYVIINQMVTGFLGQTRSPPQCYSSKKMSLTSELASDQKIRTTLLTGCEAHNSPREV